ncbi:NAD(P)-dependent alcohol dehydrogenase [Demequina sp. NBRC 110056]|uniref:NAD(P)-dependent alcohol dehydrogenase n=1 Tax=Demequina sp. NBRC 110056 TaxID=1570345 RepID=UPI0009FD8583|nr:NAD(P)-dependent alcohol dehydrogenase [Demequina sp. NBRC 110056]
MRAVTYSRYGGPETQTLTTDAPTPEPGPGEALVRVAAAGLNPYDWHIYRGDPWLARLKFGLRAPGERTVGSDVAGVVEALGPGTTRLAVGNRVCGFAGFGAAADAVAVPEDRLAVVPATVGDEEAAAVPIGALTALLGLEPLAPSGKRVLVIGASGGVGHMAVQIARTLGAARVVGVCSGRNAAMVRELGADRVIDYTRESVLDCDETFDIVYDTVATTPVRRLRRIMTADAVYAPAGALGGGRLLGPAWGMYRAVIAGRTISQRVTAVAARAEDTAEEVARVLAWVESGEVRPVVERAYPLEEHAAALLRLEGQHVAGKVVLRVA